MARPASSPTGLGLEAARRSRVRLRAAGLVLSLALAGSACSRAAQPIERDAGFGVDVTAGERLDAPLVHLRADVVPVFEARCAFTSCHGVRTSAHGVFLGRGAASEVRAGVVDVTSTRYPGQILVKPRDPRASFVMRKIDGTFGGLACGDACGAPMPKKNPALPVRERLLVARWIAQGAKDD